MEYYRYISRTLKCSFFNEHINKSYIVPFCIPHVNKLRLKQNSIMLDQKFEKWYKLPKKAHKLYWKFHLNELP